MKRYYSSQLDRELVSALYHEAKTRAVPMTLLVKRLLPACKASEFLPVEECLGLTPNEQSVENRSMKTNRLLLVGATLVFTSMGASFASPMKGTWKLNERKSTFEPRPAKNDTASSSADKHGMTQVTLDGTDKAVNRGHWTMTVNGKPHKVINSPLFDAVSYQAVNGSSNQVTLMKDGKVVSSGTVTVSEDGKSRVVKMTMRDGNGKSYTDTAYYDKR